ncbi:hypothetical protein JM946_02790 [Steroidobacter sp. S1-65]|uniref:Lipase helper protein n=1 Tax=Steroidobacter gossypii TaxID=2805490 RepID=A0ABS1WRQ6_9GAMM|nr:hypothetical protein [Steroidobacter gossypii]MBM0103649.1 hypothetical protein [Steroidobacter gossypii]
MTAPMQSSSVQPAAAPKEERLLATGDIGDVALLAHVEHKYRFLIADANPAQVEELRQRLLERESQASLAAREQLDAQIGRLLSAEGFEYFQVLKESDLEQHHLAEYTGGISNVAPLDARQERVVLDAKLRQKQRYSTVMRDLGLDRDSLSPAERKYAHEKTSEALKRYLDEFLSEVSPALTPEQYTQLKNYETTEFDRELARLQQKINAK